MASLYDLNSEYSKLLTELEFAETPEELDRIWHDIDSVEGNMEEKADAYAKILRNKIADAQMYKAEEHRFNTLRKNAENAVERIKNVMHATMLLMNISEWPTSIGKWRVQTNPASVQITDESKVPQEYREPQPDKIDKRAIMQHYKETGELLDGVEIVQTESIRFK